MIKNVRSVLLFSVCVCVVVGGGSGLFCFPVCVWGGGA